MRDEYDFSKGKRGAVMVPSGKARVTLMLDEDVVEHYRSQAEAQGIGYQSLINSLLRAPMKSPPKLTSKSAAKPLTVATLRRVLREELNAA